MTPSTALAWICAREADYLTRPYSAPASITFARERVRGSWEACIAVADPSERDAIRGVWSRWVAFVWAVEHPEDPVMTGEEEGT